MKWKDWITSPPPTTMWFVDDHEVVIVTRDRKGIISSASIKCPPGIFEIGPVGLQGLNGEQLAPLIAQLQASAQGKGRPAVVFPMSWVRSHLLEFDQLPRKRPEIEEVLRWRLKKLVPLPTNELRISWAVHKGAESKKAVLSTVGIERVFAALEANFETIGTKPGFTAPILFAWAKAVTSFSPTCLLIQQESGFLSMLMVDKGIPRLLRTKQVPKNDEDQQCASGEFHLVHKYIRGQLGITEPILVSVISSSMEVTESLYAWWGGIEGIDLKQNDRSFLHPGVEEDLGPARMAVVKAILAGETL